MNVISLSTMKRIDEGELPLGTKLIFHGQGYMRTTCYVVGEKTTGSQKVVHVSENPDELRFSDVYPGNVHDFGTTKGIGYYYPHPEQAEPLSSEQLKDLLFLANQADTKRKDARLAERIAQKEAEEQAAKWFAENTPAGATAIIIAELEKDESDSQADYFGSRTVRTVLLAFSNHRRDDFREMRKAARNFVETVHLADVEETLEHREKYTGGGGYYLGKDRYTGWKVRKKNIGPGCMYGLTFVNNPDNIKIKHPPVQKSETSGQNNIPNPGDVSGEKDDNAITIIDYSEKAFVITGNIKPSRYVLAELGGKFNARLRDAEGNLYPGWVFSKRRLDDVKMALNLAP